MAGKRITDLPLVPILYPFDYFPAARDTQTIRVPGSAMVASHIYEPHRKINHYSSQKYFTTDGATFTITNSMNNGKLVVTEGNIIIKISNLPADAFELGFQFEIFSASTTVVQLDLPLEDFSYYYHSLIDEEVYEGSGTMYGRGMSINPYEYMRLVHVAPNIWTRAAAGSSPLGNVVENINEVTEVPVTPVAPTIINTSGNNLDLSTINGTDTLVSIGSNQTTFISINGAAAYTIL